VATRERSPQSPFERRARRVGLVASAVVAVGAVAAGSFALMSRGLAANASVDEVSPTLVVTATNPSSGSHFQGASPISITFNNPMNAAVHPTIRPVVAGSWMLTSPTTFTFTPTGSFVPKTTYTITVPSGPTGVTDVANHTLAAPAIVRFTADGGSVLRLNQLLAQLNYLPESFTPTAGNTMAWTSMAPVPGSFTPRFSALPKVVATLWNPSAYTVLTKGAVMNFEYQHGLNTDGVASSDVWAALLKDAAAHKGNTHNWNYVIVNQTRPETLKLFVNGHLQYTTLVNTGASGVETAVGTYPVYLRFTSTTMSGTNPDGSHYHDAGIPWVSYFNGGDALHGYIRSTYGWPQSLGCVEMPYANAGAVWPYTPIGTLVTILPA
jgi:peptidoglycan hydrolase-like protein with peptidoglycan-binding domain